MKKIYERNSYENHIATKISAYKAEADRHYIQLEETIFFPEEGGQYADRGVLIYGNDEYRLIDGQIKDGEIWYEVPVEMKAGEPVICRLDWATRYMRMQQHSGEHILTGVIHNRYGYDNIGFHLSDDGPVTLVMSGDMSRDQVLQMERIANDVIYRNLPIIDSYPTREELEHIRYRSKIEIEGQVRLITIGEGDDVVDVCACCAPHVARTGEIGLIKVVSVAAYKGGTQIGILCGKRALDYMREEHELLDSLARSFSTSIDRIPASVEGLRTELNDIRERYSRLLEEKLLKQIEELPAGNSGCLIISEDISPAAMKQCYNALREKYSGYTGVFVGRDDSGYRYYAGSSSLDSRELATVMRQQLGAKGGGSADMIQGRVEADRSRIEEIFS